MFQLKNFVSIAASMLNYVRSTTGKVTDLQPGSVTRTILEAPAAEIEELYVQMFNGIKEAIPVAVYNSINFPKLAAHYAAGTVTVIWNDKLYQYGTTGTPMLSPPADLTIPKGTRFLARDGRIYESIGDMTWPANQSSFTVPVRSTIAGIAQNAAADEINSSPLFSPDLFDFTSSAMTQGSDIETDTDRDTRFADYIAALSRGTEAALLYGARSARLLDANGNTIESVTRVSLSIGSGTVTVSIWGSNGLPSAALVTRATQIEEGYIDTSTGAAVPGFRAAGIRCVVQPFNKHAVDADYTVTLVNGVTLTPSLIQSVITALDSYLQSIEAGVTVTAADIQTVALTVQGIVTATVALPAGKNPTCGTGEVLTAGNITVSLPVVAPVTPANPVVTP